MPTSGWAGDRGRYRTIQVIRGVFAVFYMVPGGAQTDSRNRAPARESHDGLRVACGGDGRGPGHLSPEGTSSNGLDDGRFNPSGRADGNGKGGA